MDFTGLFTGKQGDVACTLLSTHGFRGIILFEFFSFSLDNGEQIGTPSNTKRTE